MSRTRRDIDNANANYRRPRCKGQRVSPIDEMGRYATNRDKTVVARTIDKFDDVSPSAVSEVHASKQNWEK